MIQASGHRISPFSHDIVIATMHGPIGGFIRADRAKLVARYPVRHYKYYDLRIEMESDDASARVSYYQYERYRKTRFILTRILAEDPPQVPVGLF
jgi:hypothetical protein